jgi:hypothetical protein
VVRLSLGEIRYLGCIKYSDAKRGVVCLEIARK